MSKKTRLELTWIGKDELPKIEPRILVEYNDLSYQSVVRNASGNSFDNLLIHGDNLLALRALEPRYSGQVKCVFIDPPYNTFSAIPNYEDGVEHSLWLSLMRDRLTIIRNLIADDGSLWITIDDNESHYLKVLCDEIFGRSNFIGVLFGSIAFRGKTTRNTFLFIITTYTYIENQKNLSGMMFPGRTSTIKIIRIPIMTPMVLGALAMFVVPIFGKI